MNSPTSRYLCKSINMGLLSQPQLEAHLQTLREKHPGVCFEWSVAAGLQVGIPSGLTFLDREVLLASKIVVEVDKDLRITVILKNVNSYDLRSYLVPPSPGIQLSYFSPHSKVSLKGPSLFQRILNDA